MKFNRAMRAVRQGKKVGRKGWKNNPKGEEYIELREFNKDEGFEKVAFGDGTEYFIVKDDLEAEDCLSTIRFYIILKPQIQK